MAINLNQFVNVKLTHHISSTTVSQRDTAVVLFNDSSSTTASYKIYDTYSTKIITPSSGEKYTQITISNSEDSTVTLSLKPDNTGDNVLYYYVKFFFECNGKKLKIVRFKYDNSYENISNVLLNNNIISTNDIVIASTISESTMKSFLTSTVINNEYWYDRENGAEQKLFISSISSTTESSGTSTIDLVRDIPFYAIKYGIPGIEMTMAAYLTNINIDDATTVTDYGFTVENVNDYEITVGSDSSAKTYVNVTTENSLVETCIKRNFNIDGYLSNHVRNIGGNDTAGNEIINQYMLIVLQQTLTEKLVDLLMTKIRYNESSLLKLGAIVDNELQRYVVNGYLTTDKVWTDENLTYKGYTIINKNTPLVKGYLYYILPFSTLTDVEKKNHLLPDVYILIADGVSIRKINITGKYI